MDCNATERGKHMIRGKTQKEYPASHSVDTEWYAVDRDGHLANIDSGEEGWLPADIDKGNRCDESTMRRMLDFSATPICEGCGALSLPEESLKLVKKALILESVCSWIRSYDKESSDCQARLNSEVLHLANGISFRDLHCWQNRIADDNTAIYEISEDHRYVFCFNLETRSESLYQDFSSARIIRSGTFDDDLVCYYYYIDDEFGLDAIMTRRESSSLFGLIPFPLSVPEGCKDVKRLDMSFSCSKEFDLEEHIGMYVSGYLCSCINDPPDYSQVIDSFAGLSATELVSALFLSITHYCTRAVWCLLDIYGVDPLSVSPENGKTAIELAKGISQDNPPLIDDGDGHGTSALRIYRMLCLKAHIKWEK